MEYAKPRIGLVGITQAIYDDMLPGITDRQAGYARQVVAHLGDVADVIFSKPIKSRADIEEVIAGYEREQVDGLMIVMLTFGPAMRTIRAFDKTDLPLLLANIQPERNITERWDMGDMTYNQGIHGAQDTANTLVRLGKRFAVITDDWRTPEFKQRFADWAYAARAISAWRTMKIAVFGYAMEGMGDIRVDEHSFLRNLGPEIQYLAPGDLYRAMLAAAPAEVRTAIEDENNRFEIDPRLSAEQREESARYHVALRKILAEGGYAAYSTHFGAIAEDGRFKFLPLAAASNLMAEGYGYGGEGDVCSAAAVAAGHALIGDGNFTEMYAMDFDRDTTLLSHMGEGNWKLGRTDEKPRLIDRPLGIGKMDNPPTVLFRLQPGPATLVSLAPVGRDQFHLVIAEGEIIPDSPVMPILEMPYGEFRPTTGVRACLDGWLKAGGTHHLCMNPGHHAARWTLFAEMLGIRAVVV
ncbi:MAG: L-fucose/L-arabinose isomerase family protein [Chloroflexi bacterium]|nr:L-fucose/L-arabinose isomerase family protein [Chloroflexota bacterium]